MLQLICTLPGHTEDRVWCASWSKNGRYLASSGEDKTIRIFTAESNCWEEASGVKCIATLEDGQSRTIRSCEWSPCSKFIASASFDGTVVIWEAQNISFTKWDMIASLEGHENEVKCVGWSPNGRWLATCGRDKNVWIWELVGEADFECVTILQGHTQDVKSLVWVPDGKTLLTCSYDDSIKVWKEDGDDFFCSQTLHGHSSTVWELALGPGSIPNNMVSCSADKSLICWKFTGMAESEWMKVCSLDNLHQQPIYSVDWSGNNGFIASGGGDNAICLSKLEEGECGFLTREYKLAGAHDCDINCVRWNPNDSMSNILVSTGDDGVVKIWQLIL